MTPDNPTRDSEPPVLNGNPLDLDLPRVLFGGFSFVTIIALVIAASTSGTAFGAYNPAWDGASSLQSLADDAGTESTIITNTTQYPTNNTSGTIAFVLSPDRPYSPHEAARLHEFVANGGTLIVAEDYGQHSDLLLSEVGASAQFNGSVVRDDRHNYRSPGMPVARGVGEGPYTQTVSSLTMNYGTVVEPGTARPVVNTSGFAYLDMNRNQTIDDSEPLGTFPIMTTEQIDEGRVIAISDPSIFINAMLERPGNRQFVMNTFRANDRVLLDYSHARKLPPLTATLLLVRSSPLLQLLTLTGAISLVAFWGRGWFPSLFSRLDWRDMQNHPTKLDEEAVMAVLRERHPNWDERRLERVTKGVITTRHNLDHDD